MAKPPLPTPKGILGLWKGLGGVPNIPGLAPSPIPGWKSIQQLLPCCSGSSQEFAPLHSPKLSLSRGLGDLCSKPFSSAGEIQREPNVLPKEGLDSKNPP